MISTLTLSRNTSGVKLYSSSSSAARNVPGPRTSTRSAAISAATLNTHTLSDQLLVLFVKLTQRGHQVTYHLGPALMILREARFGRGNPVGRLRKT
jgi:hypothetical protein